MVDEQKDQDRGIDTFDYNTCLEGVREYVRELCKQQKNPTYYTPHDANHCYAVEQMVVALIKESKPKLSDLERFILFSAAWTHDLGMLDSVADEFFKHKKSNGQNTAQNIRKKHDKISAWHLSSNYKKIFLIKSDNLALPVKDEDEVKDEVKDEVNNEVNNMLRNYAYTINIISKFHRMEADINDCPKQRYVKGEVVKTRLLAAFLRLGDTLHVDSSRFDRRVYDVLLLGQLDRSARLHWLKSYVVSNVYLDSGTGTIFVNIDLPECNELFESDKTDGVESIKSLENAIISDIFNDVLAVSDVFREHGLPAYAMVKPNLSLVPGFPSKDIEEIKGIIGDLGVAFSPNTSKVIEKAFDSITSLCNIDFGTKSEQFHLQMRQLLAYLDEVHKIRPCHVALGKVIGTAKEVFKSEWKKVGLKDTADEKKRQKQIRQCQRAISTELDELKVQREQNIKKLYGLCCETDLLKPYKNIILFAYSEMVTTFLEKYGRFHQEWKENVNLYVLECSGKRRLKSNESMEYIDGLYYASQLSLRNFKNISLLPDTSFGSLVYNFEEDKEIEESLILFGVNGIDEGNEDCGHTSGHLMIALIAEKCGIPVWIIADSFKRGKIKWERKLMRGSSWLVGQKKLENNLKQRNIMPINYLEDRIPRKLINKIITEEYTENRAI